MKIGKVATATINRALIEQCAEDLIWAVVGASTNPSRWGYCVYRALRESGYRVYPVNPRAKVIDGDRCDPSLLSLPERPGVVDVVVPPNLGRVVADDAATAGIPRIWFQPGAESPENVAHSLSLGLRVVHRACALVGRRWWT